MGSLGFRGGWDRYHGWGGLVVLAVGVILLLDRLGVIYARDVFQFWPVLLVAAGTVALVEAGSLTVRTIGGTLLAMGLILQANNLGYLHIRGDVFWPLALVGADLMGANLPTGFGPERNGLSETSNPPAASTRRCSATSSDG